MKVLVLCALSLLAWPGPAAASSVLGAQVGGSRSADAAELEASFSPGEPLPGQEGAESPVGGETDLGVERALLEGAEAALERSDFAAAREGVSRAIDSLLSRPLPARGESWLGLLERAGRAAWGARDAESARRAFEQVLEVRSRTLSGDHPDLQSARLSMAVMMADSGDLLGARALLEPVLEVRSRTSAEGDPGLLLAQQSLALTIKGLGDLHGARALEEQVLRVSSRTLPAEHYELQAARLNLAVTIARLGDLYGARVLLEQVLEVFSRTLPPDHPDLQLARQNLAVTIKGLGDLQAARALEVQVLGAFTRILPEDHRALQAARLNLAVTLVRLGDPLGAHPLLERVLEVFERTLPADHADLQMARQNLALTILESGGLDRALPLLEQVLEDRSRTLPGDHPDLQGARVNMALALAAESARREWGGRLGAADGGMEEARERCVELLRALCRSRARAARQGVLASSPRETEERSARTQEDLGRALSFALGYGVFPPARELVPDVWVLSETTRGVALASAVVARRAGSSERYRDLRAALREAGKELASLARAGTTSEGFQAAVRARDALEVELVGLAGELVGSQAASLELEAGRLSAVLGESRAAIAYRRFTRSDVRISGVGAEGDPAVPSLAATESLCAFVVRGGDPGREGSLALVDLGPIAPVEAAVAAWRDALGTSADRGIGLDPSARDLLHARGDALRRLILDPVLSEVAGAQRLALVVDDVLHLVPLDALPLESEPAGAGAPLVGSRLASELRSHLGELLAPPPRRTDAGLLVALGGASFNSSPLGPSVEDLALAQSSGVDVPAQVAVLLRGSAWERGFTPLTYTHLEAREIAELHREVFEQETTITLERRRASRESLDALAPRARWLHVATHGWYASESIRSWEDPELLDAYMGLRLRQGGEEQVRGSSPMLLCGLALAGANLPEDGLGRAPGLITAEELSTLDLSSCELAVLSACDTNVGQRRAGQGVASLQRALQMAGARSVITSLWKVPDEATRDLMLDFYRRLWVERKPKHQALWEAKMRLREARDERGEPRYAPRDWAAWVLTGEPD